MQAEQEYHHHQNLHLASQPRSQKDNNTSTKISRMEPEHIDMVESTSKKVQLMSRSLGESPQANSYPNFINKAEAAVSPRSQSIKMT